MQDTRLGEELVGQFRHLRPDIDDDHALMRTYPRALFISIYFAEDTDAATASIYQFRARLAHICDGFPVPADLAALAASAINAFAFMTERLRPVELQITDDEEIPF